MSTIVILTASFPFPGGEQFLETEIEYWRASNDRVILLPATARGVPRQTPEGILVDLTLARTRNRINKLAAMLTAPATRLFRKEFAYLRSIRRLSRSTLYHAARSISQALVAERGIRKTVRKYAGVDLVYTYWNDNESCGAALAKRHGYIAHTLSRAHRYDLYEDSRPGGHLPLKRQLINDLDAVFAISDSGREYMTRTYGVHPSRVFVSRLGVPIMDAVAEVSPSNHCNLVSISSCIRVKRVDKIVQAIALVAARSPATSFRWTHLGGGPLLADLRQLARRDLSDFANVSYSFMGPVPHSTVLDFLREEATDVFINSSESEGIPVAIMEAMSFGIPPIAPDVGGVSEIIADGTGVLLTENPSAEEVAGQIERFMTVAKLPETRALARHAVAKEFDAQSNYTAFVAHCSKIAAS